MNNRNREINQLAGQAEELAAYIRQLRIAERSLDARMSALNEQFQVPNSNVEQVRESLIHHLPTELVPLNIGGIEKAAWNMWYPNTFSFTGLTELNDNLKQSQFFQVTPEAAFIMTHIEYSFPLGKTPANESAPWALEFFDRQSTRQLQSNPIPVQIFGKQGWPSQLTTPYLLMPNAQFEVKLSCIQTLPFTLAAPEDMQLQVTFSGIRIRVEDAAEILSTIYKRRS